MMKLRWQIRPLRRSPGGVPMLAFGVRVGYWPCLKAPFVQVVFAKWRAEVWFGLPTYKA